MTNPAPPAEGDLGRCFDVFKVSAFRLETLRGYAVPGEDEGLRAFLRGLPRPERSVRTSAVDGTFIWTPSHDQRPRSLSTALPFVRCCDPCWPGTARWSARSDVRTNDVDGRRSVELPGLGQLRHATSLRAWVPVLAVRR
jgi:hypothetical protein